MSHSRAEWRICLVCDIQLLASLYRSAVIGTDVHLALIDCGHDLGTRCEHVDVAGPPASRAPKRRMLWHHAALCGAHARARAHTRAHVVFLRVADTDRPGVIARQCLLQPSPGRQQLRLACAARPVPPAPHAAWVAYRWLAVAHGVYQQQIHLLYTQLPQVLRAHNSHTHTGTCGRARTHPERARGRPAGCARAPTRRSPRMGSSSSQKSALGSSRRRSRARIPPPADCCSSRRCRRPALPARTTATGPLRAPARGGLLRSAEGKQKWQGRAANSVPHLSLPRPLASPLRRCSPRASARPGRSQPQAAQNRHYCQLVARGREARTGAAA